MMRSGLVLLLCFVLFESIAFAQDANACPNYPTCEICLQHNLCGWCAVPVVYSDGTEGPRCAGKPQNPDNPPPGWKPWTCPQDFQNLFCYGYVCTNTTYQCVSAGPHGGGQPLDQCRANCFPPTYDCNHTTHQCYQVPPGHGTDLPDCQKQCQQTSTGATTAASTGLTTGRTTGGNSTGNPSAQGYTCDPTTLKCIQAPNGAPKNICDSMCGIPPNNTPIFVIGDYRGLEIDKTFVKGEWQAKITDADITIVDPTGQTWAKGSVRQYTNELWLVTQNGTRRGLFGIQQLAEVEVLTWAMGAFGQPPPTSFDSGLTNGKSFVFARCLNPALCKFHIFQALAQLKFNQQKWIKERDSHIMADPINDPCSVFPDCQKCITAPSFCGWCSVNVVYNGSIVGKNCAGLNTTITPRFNCSGQFSTITCLSPTTSNSTGRTTGQTTGNPALQYFCDPINATCVQSPNGTLPREVCNAQCTVNPIPPFLQNKYFRGLQIQQGYRPGEWRAHFGTNTLSVVNPDGTVMQGNVSVVGQYISVSVPAGKFQTLWQFQPGAAVDNLSWAWGAINQLPPASFDQAMNTPGQTQFWYVSCHDGAPTTVCDFSK